MGDGSPGAVWGLAGCSRIRCKHVVPAPCGVCLLVAPGPSLGHHGLPLSTGQRGPEVRLDTSRLGHDHQQTGSDPDFEGMAVFTPVINDVNSQSAKVQVLLVVPGSPPIPVHHPPPEGRPHCHDLLLHHSATCLLLCFRSDNTRLDPDNFSIPYLTALGDLLGTGLLALSFRLILTLGSTGAGV